MRHSALALILSAPVVCLAFAPKRLQTRGALKLSSIATVDVSSPAAMGVQINSFLDGMKKEKLAKFRVICSQESGDSLTTQLDEAVRELHELNNEEIYPESRPLAVGFDTSGASCKAAKRFDPNSEMTSICGQSSSRATP